MEILGYTLDKTCSACPEQYDVYKNGEQVAYFRLRHGYFCAQCPDAFGVEVYSANPEGDGIFKPHERDKYLLEALLAVEKYIGG